MHVGPDRLVVHTLSGKCEADGTGCDALHSAQGIDKKLLTHLKRLLVVGIQNQWGQKVFIVDFPAVPQCLTGFQQPYMLLTALTKNN